MMDSDDDYSSSGSSSAVEPIQDDYIANGRYSLRPSPRNSRNNKPKKDSKERVSLPDNLRSLVMKLNHVSQLLHGQDFDENMTLRVLAAAMRLQGNYLQKLGKAGRGKKRAFKNQKSETPSATYSRSPLIRTQK